ncbi:thiamine pyrophosphate-dependent dehydrogenase E1 component subunit alpha [Pseudidiomarina terrestris]|uniref:2-oxoisovalerate dehydrogenase subunit alpha n=1 Tax=Pseudidiomarina terrestris TaxID=2820060 RepID=A0AAW7QYX0_9GAMM|nr:MULTISPECIES: thiamine pyrophosphate-dependent dehydrogenase E1 component subunit alpha [unclassified Pseudidiomarina]MDN7123932.1 thiamine pyrophosphate-dependent dehydrogenase E1 component subunit alpha [Pseudidiomarina sp. 1APP75-32.1]MDN7127686.1 thiamine pyrophosphate-dependent dehydrogenase E1 component subunit alpha [Pseudidiomarina sp. 1APR75-33.1]MDN7130432.1 thiamine pyrophosphate-dependent dehydrogenase E1 component subunit alpha [Pseudidiomarina sp. 1APR75-15]MDN7136355.1 thiamin
MAKDKQHQLEIVTEPKFIDGSALKIPMLQILKEDGTVQKGAQVPELDKELALKMFDTMQFIRILDERMIAAQRQGRISFYLSSLGEEAASIGSAAALDDGDMIMGQYREQGALAYRGFTVEQFMDQLFSNERDLGKGRQMPVHYGSAELNFMTIASPLATQIPQATGYAFGQKMDKSGTCTICYFGEGAASEGDFHAALNMAAVYKVPAIFFCRNNGYAISTPSQGEQYAGDGIAPRGVAYGMKTIRVDGNDILAVYQATQMARKLAVEDNEPVLIEGMSYRMAGHSTSDDPTGYRTRDEEDAWRAKDPLARFQTYLIKKKWLTEKDAEEIFAEKKAAVLAALKKAEKVPAPHIDELINDVYDTPPQQLKEQLEQLKAHIRKYPEAYPKTASRIDGGEK